MSVLAVLTSCCPPALGADTGYAAKAVDLLDRPGSQANVVTKLAKRQPVEIIGRDGSWAKAKSGNTTGWVRLADLRLNVATSKPPASPAARSNSGKKDTGIRGFSQEELLVGAPNQALEMMRSQMEGAQDSMAGRDAEAARAYKNQSEAMAQQGKKMEEQLRKDPKYVRAQEEHEREEREFLRKNPSGTDRQDQCDVTAAVSGNGQSDAELDRTDEFARS